MVAVNHIPFTSANVPFTQSTETGLEHEKIGSFQQIQETKETSKGMNDSGGFIFQLPQYQCIYMPTTILKHIYLTCAVGNLPIPVNSWLASGLNCLSVQVRFLLNLSSHSGFFLSSSMSHNMIDYEADAYQN